MLFLIIIVIVSYVLIQTLEIFSFGARVAGRLTNRAALGTTLSQTVHTLSRFLLILLMKEEGMGNRMFSRKLNQWGIKTHRGKEWFNYSLV